ncbi:hypothetical protein [Stenotrophomonas sp. OVS01A]|uniref:hypothetical protein n=1 Tax=Stenotrophomonas sp. OVS01A TaxID=2862680 RepID=UPI001CBCCBE6|nr:hypothetical protein [Stenotrophomonas sp. OVS01A]
MAKLSKAQIKAHKEVMDLVDLDRPLFEDEREFILDNFQESATNVNSQHGAFFTPRGLAVDLSIEIGKGSIVDLCAGIGSLAYAVRDRATRLVCIEFNPEYARVGRRVVPEAEWIVASIFDPLIAGLGWFNYAISNPPFGYIAAEGFDGKYTGKSFEYKAIEVASRMAAYGAFIIPQCSAPFAYSGKRLYNSKEGANPRKFREQTGIVMEFGTGVDTAYYQDEWNGVSPLCEIVVCDFVVPEEEVADLQESAPGPSEATAATEVDLFGFPMEAAA